MSRYDDHRVIEIARQLGTSRKKRALRELKRREAIDRNSRTEPEKRASFRHQAGLLQDAPPVARKRPRRRRKPKESTSE